MSGCRIQLGITTDIIKNSLCCTFVITSSCYGVGGGVWFSRLFCRLKIQHWWWWSTDDPRSIRQQSFVIFHLRPLSDARWRAEKAHDAQAWKSGILSRIPLTMKVQWRWVESRYRRRCVWYTEFGGICWSDKIFRYNLSIN